MVRRLKFVIACLSAVLSLGAEATPTLTPIGNVTILGNDYSVSLLSDVSYAAQSYNLLSPTITFTTVSDAEAAATALLYTFGGYYNWNPTCGDCGDGTRVLYGVNSQVYEYWTVYRGRVNGPFSNPVGDGNDLSFAQFSAAVPEPEVYAMMLAGLGLLGFGARRSKQKIA